jgi:transcriptional regulator with XRE-family HTH domain
MVAGSGRAPTPAGGLAERLRELRETEYERLTQDQLAKVLGGPGGLSGATISQWESPGSGRLPKPLWLARYARLFCSARSFSAEEPRLLADDELTEQERQKEAHLAAELQTLRDQVQVPVFVPAPEATRSPLWQFPDQNDVSIVASDAPTSEQPPYAGPSHLNYSRYARHADLDALVEVYGRIRADNPKSTVRILPTDLLEREYTLNHLVIIGGAAAQDTAGWLEQAIPGPVGIPLPEAELLPDRRTHVFKCSDGDETREFRSLYDGETLVKDVGLIARWPHRLAPGRTVTMLSGITSRGVHGAALCFTDSVVSGANEKYLQEAFGNADAFCILMSVPVRKNAALPSNLWNDGARLFEWCAETGARW